MEKCFNVDCEDNEAEEENGCYFDDTSNCIGFVSKKQWKEKMVGLGLKKLSDPEYGCMSERDSVNMEENEKGGLPPNSSLGGRMNARNVLQAKIKDYEKVINSLRVLESSIRWESLSKKQEEFLWHYFITSK